MRQAELDNIAVSSRRAAILSILGAIIILGSLSYSAFKLSEVERTVFEKQQEVAALDAELKKRGTEIATLSRDVDSLQNTQDGLLDFLARVTDNSKVSILDRDVDWGVVKTDLEKLPSGNRKQALLTAILLAWKDIPFTMGKQSVSQGFDSPRFIEFVLSKNGIKIDKRNDERMSDALMRSFRKVDQPRPGDLVFYEGQVGSFGFIYLSDGKPSSAGVGIGTLQAAAPLQIISLNNINTSYFPLIGYFRVVYPDETALAQQTLKGSASR